MRGGGGGMTPGCIAACNGRRLLASRHLPSAGGGSHRTHPLFTSLSLLSLPLPPCSPFLSLGRLCQRAPGLALFHCSVSGPHRGGQLPSPLARSVPVDPPYRRCGTPPQRRLLGPRMSTCGGVTSACHNLPPVRSRAQSSFWQAHHVPPHPRLLSVVCVLCVHSLA